MGASYFPPEGTRAMSGLGMSTLSPVRALDAQTSFRPAWFTGKTSHLFSQQMSGDCQCFKVSAFLALIKPTRIGT